MYFKKGAWMEVQAPGFQYYHSLAKMDEMFSEDMLLHYVDMPWMAKPYFYSSDSQGIAQDEAITIPETILCKAIQIEKLWSRNVLWLVEQSIRKN